MSLTVPPSRPSSRSTSPLPSAIACILAGALHCLAATQASAQPGTAHAHFDSMGCTVSATYAVGGPAAVAQCLDARSGASSGVSPAGSGAGVTALYQRESASATLSASAHWIDPVTITTTAANPTWIKVRFAVEQTVWVTTFTGGTGSAWSELTPFVGATAGPTHRLDAAVDVGSTNLIPSEYFRGYIDVVAPFETALTLGYLTMVGATVSTPATNQQLHAVGRASSWGSGRNGLIRGFQILDDTGVDVTAQSTVTFASGFAHRVGAPLITPEPATVGLVAAGLVALGTLARRRGRG